MKIYIRFGLLMTLGVLAVAQPPGIKVLTAGTRSFTATATTQAGETPLLVRQIRFDNQLSNGKNGKSVLLLLFEPISGFVYRTAGWTEKDYPEAVHNDSLPRECRVAIAPDRLAFFGLTNWQLTVCGIESAQFQFGGRRKGVLGLGRRTSGGY